MLKGRESSKGHGGAPPADLLVCFPTRTRLSLMPKPICSPSRPNSEPNKRHNHHLGLGLKRINTRAGSSSSSGAGAGVGPGSPLIWAKDNQIRGGGPEMSEPTSPKVTCAGQIKVRPRSANSCRNWQSVMEEIERIHNRTKHKKKSNWGGTFGFKKDVMGFLTCLRSLKFDFRCFGSFPEQILSSDDEGEEDDDDVFEEEDSFQEIVDVVDDDKGSNGINDNSAVFSKWFMVLQENQSNNNNNSSTKKLETEEMGNDDDDDDDDDDCAPAIPPPNALLLMRCRSAPAKSWLEVKENEEKNKEESDDDEEEEEEEKAVKETEEENEEELIKKKRETLAIVMKYDTDFYKLSTDIAKETWVVGEIKDPFSRSRSCRR